MRDDCAFEVFLVILWAFFKTEKLQNHRVFDDFSRGLRLALVACKGKNFFLIIAHQKTLVKHRVDLAFKLAACPSFIHCLKFIVLPFVGIRYLNQSPVLSPA